MGVQLRKNRRIIFGGLGILIALVLAVKFLWPTAAPINPVFMGLTAEVYRSPSCGCCALYISYLRRAGIKVEEKLIADMSSVRKQFSVPESLSSCHTARIGGYTVEGHIPLEAIEKLISEKPAIDGIALSDMPSGSPGMPGAKVEVFEIKSFTVSGSSTPYLNI